MMQTRARDLRTEKAESVVSWAHDRLQLSYEAIGEAVGASRRSVLRWRAGRTAPRPGNEERLDRLDELRFWLAQVFESDRAAADRWLRTRLRDLGGKTPLEIILAGDVERAIEMLATYETGAFV